MTGPVHSATDDAVYATVSYADVFDLPVALQDVHRYLVGAPRTLLETSMAVDNLVTRQRLGRRGDVVHLAGRSKVLDIYDQRAARAASMWKVAEQWGQRIGRLPLVRMVAVTGGPGFGGLADGDDITFFIVVRPRRLWLARWMIMRVCRTAAKENVQLRASVIVSTRSSEMDDRSLHVARALAQMAVIVGDDVCQTVRRSNAWIFNVLPNATVTGDQSHLSTVAPTSRQRWTEWLLLQPPFRIAESCMRKVAIAKLKRSVSDDAAVIAVSASSFSTEACKGDLVAESVRIEVEWQRRLNPR